MFLSDDLLEAIHSRAAKYDKENTFPHEDYAALKEAAIIRHLFQKNMAVSGLILKRLLTSKHG